MEYSVELIKRYFPDLTSGQIEQFAALRDIYADWNAKINVISRKDFDSLYLHHILHSLAIARVCRFEAGAKVADVGCGGGFPSVPLAILFPEAEFTSIDSIGKKITVVKGVCEAAGIKNIRPINARIESIDEEFDYVVSRAVTDMSTFVGWVWRKLRTGSKGSIPNGILYLKGGDLAQELSATKLEWRRYPIAEMFEEEFFATKEVVYTPKR
ncbi:MAG: 16S rRNA (guanine(527)-N(7))-methyltransferase RsmG [Alistipes sp.]|nr:16S rRNA (guanine(527)-N(7))-methyltransferase RsmG [Alistipes sp.]